MQETKRERRVPAYRHDSPTRCFVLYREQMFRLLSADMPEHDQLVVELPCLMGFRAKEVSTWRAEYIDWDSGDTSVMDAKKHKLFKVPLHCLVAAHAEKLLDGRTEGYVIQNTSTACRTKDRPISTVAVWYIWKKWVRKLNLPNGDEISPLAGRRFFAAEWFYRQHLNPIILSMMMRHGDVSETFDYIKHLIFFEDMRIEYRRFQFGTLEAQPPNPAYEFVTGYST